MRYLCALFALVLPVSGLSALEVSAGIGASVGAFSSTSSASENIGNVTLSSTQRNNQYPFGILAFVDATYLQLSFGYTMARGGTTDIYGSAYSTTTLDETVPLDLDTTYLSLTALAKYPFHVGTTVLFPLLGIEYDLNLTYTNSSGSSLTSSLASPGDANQLWIRAGGGLDIPFGHFYLRPELLLGYKILNQTERNWITSQLAAGAAGASYVDLDLGLRLLAGFDF